MLVVVALLGAPGCGDEATLDCAEQTFGLTAAVEQWRELVEKYFKYQHVTWALNIIKCESGGNPNAVNSSSGASGLFQHLPKYWPDRAAKAGFPGASPFNPEANIAASAWLLYAAGGGPQHWSCKYSPFEDFNYVPQFYKNGVPVKTCTPGCSGTKLVGADCKEGDCAAYGSICVDDSLGPRCVFSLCPAKGTKRICINSVTLGVCDDGAVKQTDCAVSGKVCESGTFTGCVTPPEAPDSTPPQPADAGALDAGGPDVWKLHAADVGAMPPTDGGIWNQKPAPQAAPLQGGCAVAPGRAADPSATPLGALLLLGLCGLVAGRRF